MKVAVIQHLMREDLAADVDALAESVATACDGGAGVVVCPAIPSILADPETARPALLGKLDRCPEGTALLIPFREPGAEPTSPVKPTPLGDAALLLGDECISPTMTGRLLAAPPAAIVMRPLCESELQIEAVLERALSLSVSVSGLVIVAECSGAGFSEPGHGGSAIVYLGEVIAEALDGDDVLTAEIAVPIGEPEPRESLISLPPILEQRIAFHQGRKAEVGYLADLS